MSDKNNGGREHAYRQLHESEELHRATLTNISDAVFLTDDEGRFTFICPNVDVIFGYSPDEVNALERIGKLLGDGLFDRADLAARGEIRNIERQVTVKSGEPRTVLVHVKSVSIQNGTVLYCCRDVTELKHAEEQLRAVRAELTHVSRLAVVGQLVASITHEMKQPLTAILANAGAGNSILAREPGHPRSTELREIFVDIAAASSRAGEVIERLRVLARKKPLTFQPVDVNALVHETLRLVEPDARRRHITLCTELEPGLPQVRADRVCLQQVLLSLVLNAMEAMDDSGNGTRRAVLKTHLDSSAVDVSVSDTGHGVSAAHLPRLFEPFFTTKNEGLGLGLAIARSIVEAHAGRIWADGSESGAIFHVVLPTSATGSA
jgi:PAS domain S-box-containing protein